MELMRLKLWVCISVALCWPLVLHRIRRYDSLPISVRSMYMKLPPSRPPLTAQHSAGAFLRPAGSRRPLVAILTERLGGTLFSGNEAQPDGVTTAGADAEDEEPAGTAQAQEEENEPTTTSELQGTIKTLFKDSGFRADQVTSITPSIEAHTASSASPTSFSRVTASDLSPVTLQPPPSHLQPPPASSTDDNGEAIATDGPANTEAISIEDHANPGNHQSTKSHSLPPVYIDEHGNEISVSHSTYLDKDGNKIIHFPPTYFDEHGNEIITHAPTYFDQYGNHKVTEPPFYHHVAASSSLRPAHHLSATVTGRPKGLRKKTTPNPKAAHGKYKVTSKTVYGRIIPGHLHQLIDKIYHWYRRLRFPWPRGYCGKRKRKKKKPKHS